MSEPRAREDNVGRSPSGGECHATSPLCPRIRARRNCEQTREVTHGARNLGCRGVGTRGRDARPTQVAARKMRRGGGDRTVNRTRSFCRSGTRKNAGDGRSFECPSTPRGGPSSSAIGLPLPQAGAPPGGLARHRFEAARGPVPREAPTGRSRRQNTPQQASRTGAAQRTDTRPVREGGHGCTGTPAGATAGHNQRMPARTRGAAPTAAPVPAVRARVPRRPVSPPTTPSGAPAMRSAPAATGWHRARALPPAPPAVAPVRASST